MTLDNSDTLFLSIFHRAFPKVFLDVFAKEADIGEIQFEGDFLYGKVCLEQVIFDVTDGTLSNPIHRRTPSFFLTYSAQIFWSDKQLFGVCPDFTLGVSWTAEQGHETLE